ncbi:hypothetical protein [Aliikangiella sp. IMCC44359]|uniref:hypothetical protein n=1 Tax=Aliikangiella sp. IMCC44359 TaxID=3459125 RepID=UPI00403AB0EE
MEDIVELAIKFVVRIILGFFRVLLFIGWDLLFEIVGWSVGWFFCRLVTFGYFPKEKLSELDKAPIITALIVELIGLMVLVISILLLGQLI